MSTEHWEACWFPLGVRNTLRETARTGRQR